MADRSKRSRGDGGRKRAEPLPPRKGAPAATVAPVRSAGRAPVRPKPAASRGKGGGPPTKAAGTGSRTPATGRARPAKRRTRGRPLLRRFLVWGMVVGVWAVVALGALVAWYAYDLPDVDSALALDRQPTVSLLDRDDRLLRSTGDMHGRAVAVADLPPHLPRAVIAIEDRRFYDHVGVDLFGLVRAVGVNLLAGDVRQGGSTITQQLAKNLFLTHERTVRRKVQELLLAFWLERKFTKDQILGLYLNRVYLGAGTYGVDAAARRYFGRPATEVGLAEAAMLAGLLKAPTRYAPTANPEGAAARASVVLGAMTEAGFIDAKAAAAARAAAATLTPRQTGDAVGGRWFADWALDRTQGFVGRVDRDVTVTTTLDTRLQRFAHEAVRAGLAGANGNPSQAALVALRPDGAVVAMIGGRHYGESQFNRVTQARRQPGSAFKPFVFLAALESGLGPDDRVLDAPVAVGDWQPGNYRDRYHGEVTLREAMARSLNAAAVRLGQQVGPARVAATARRLGIAGPLRAEPSLALGASEVTLLELTAAYAAFARDGHPALPHAVLSVRDRQGNELYRRSGSGTGAVIAPAHLAGMVDMLHAVTEWGTGRSARIDRPIAGKTGTSQDFRDAWFVGFSADLVAGVWVGNDDGRPMEGITGGALPARIWHDFMAAAEAGRPVRPLPRPAVSSAAAPVPPVTAPPVTAPPATVPALSAPPEDRVGRFPGDSN